jgi:PIN domain nuclease of toxin-antitoxin system
VEALIHLDTHAVVWLYARDLSCFTRAGLSRLDANDLFISPMVVLELEYLYETGRIQAKSRTICDSLEQAVGLHVCEAPFAAVVRLALEQTWTRDPFDRLIVAQAELADAPLLTKDHVIRKQYQKAFWD